MRDSIVAGTYRQASHLIIGHARQAAIGVKAERRPLEELARPLSGIR